MSGETGGAGASLADVNFDRIASGYDASRGGQERAGEAARDLALHLPPGDVLEIGVGTGIVAEALRAEAPHLREIVGVDVSAEMLALAARRLPARVVRARAQQLPFPAGRFDGVTAVHILHLVPDLTATLAEVARVLRPGGRMVAVHGLPETDRRGEFHEIMARMVPFRVRHDSPEEVRAAAATVGLRCVEQHPATPRTSSSSPNEVADLISRRTWSYLWSVTDEQWQAGVVPVLEALRALPEPDRRREHRAWMTVSVLAAG